MNKHWFWLQVVGSKSAKQLIAEHRLNGMTYQQLDAWVEGVIEHARRDGSISRQDADRGHAALLQELIDAGSMSDIMWVSTCRRIGGAKLGWIRCMLDDAGIPSKTVKSSRNTPTLMVQIVNEDATWDFIEIVDQLPDDDPAFHNASQRREEIDNACAWVRVRKEARKDSK